MSTLRVIALIIMVLILSGLCSLLIIYPALVISGQCAQDEEDCGLARRS